MQFIHIDSDDNSSIQSSPWQRDHCWKQSRPRHNISKEMAFTYTRPTRLYLSHDCQKNAKCMRRRPLHKSDVKVKFQEKKNKDVEVKKEEKEEEGVKEEKIDKNGKDEEEEQKNLNESSDKGSSSNDSKESIDALDGGDCKIETRLEKRKLSKIVQKLSDQMTSKLALNGNGANGHHHHHNHSHHHHHHHASTAVIPTSYSLASHIANSINSQSPHQHVSPRKRILRELEKVSLEDSKRSRPKSITVMTNGNGGFASHYSTPPPPAPQQQSSMSMANGSLKNEKAQPPVSRPISSYSITSLLAHNTSSSNNNDNNSSNNNNNINSIHNDSLTTSHQRLHTPPAPKSPSSMLLQNSKRKSPTTSPPGANQNQNNNNNNNMQSPIQSPSPEHHAHAFHKYRPVATTPTSSSITAPTSSSSPYSGSYPSPNYMPRSSPSPISDVHRLRTNTGNFQSSSPSRYSPRDSSLSPNVEKRGNTPRTVPKKTAALRQQFSSPTMNESGMKSNKPPPSPSQSSQQQKSNNVNNNDVKPMDVDSLLRPSALIAPPPIPLTHPAAALSHYPYMYSPLSYIPPHPAVSPYYHPFYNPAMMAAAAAYRLPIPGYPPPPGVIPTCVSTPSSSNIAYTSAMSSHSSSSSSLDKSNGQRNHSMEEQQLQHHHPAYIAASPWNPIPLTNHSINDGNIIPKVKDEQSSGKSHFL